MTEETGRKSKSGALVLKLMMVVLMIGGWGAGAYFYSQNQGLSSQVEELKTNPRAVVEEETQELVDKVSKLVALPEGENPVLATVTDKERLGDLPFFERAENGDKVLIYPQARRIYLYDPETDKVLEAAPLNIGGAALAEAEVRVALRNGTEVSELVGELEEGLTQAMPNSTIVIQDSASRSDFGQTLLIDLSGSNASLVAELAQAMGAQVSELPEGEAAPEADILVIVGGDRVR